MGFEVDGASSDAPDALWRRLAQADMTPDEAAQYLQHVPKVTRGFGETLHSLRPDVDIVATLRSFYLGLDSRQNQRSLTKRLQNWMADRNPPTNREEVYRIAFALHLSETELSELLSVVNGYGIQYRNGREVVLAWFLTRGYGYQEAVDFYDTLPSSRSTEVFEGGEASNVTREVAASFAAARNTDELRVCYEQNLERFGFQHARAYYYFERYLERLIQPSSGEGMPEERRYSIKTVMDTYLALHMPTVRKRDTLTPVQKLIKQNWPNETAIKDIRAHKADVPRKLLMILYVVTENEDLDEDGDQYDFKDSFRDHWLILDAMLSDCGMARLDMRNAFDWLVLYATAASEDESMSDRMEAVISELYG